MKKRFFVILALLGKEVPVSKLIFAALYTYISSLLILFMRQGVLPLDHVAIIGLLCLIGIFWLRSAFVIPMAAALFSGLNGIMIWASVQGWEGRDRIPAWSAVAALVVGVAVSTALAFVTTSYYQDWHEAKKGWSRLVFLFVFLTFGPIVLIPSWTLLACCAVTLLAFYLVVRRKPWRFETYSGGGSSPMYVARDEVPPY